MKFLTILSFSILFVFSETFGVVTLSDLSKISDIGHLRTVKTVTRSSQHSSITQINSEDTENDALSETDPFKEPTSMQIFLETTKRSILKMLLFFKIKITK